MAVSPDIGSVTTVDFSTADQAENVDSIGFLDGDPSPWVAGPEDYFAVRYTSELVIETGGTYRLEMFADDGAVVRIDGETLLSNEDSHPDELQLASVTLAPGSHSLEVLYLERAEDELLHLKWAGPDTDEQMVSFIAQPGAEAPEPTPEAALAESLLATSVPIVDGTSQDEEETTPTEEDMVI